MAVSSIAPITDHIAQAIDRLPQQFKGLEEKYHSSLDSSVSLSGWEALLTAFVNPAQEFENICGQLLGSYSLDTAIGNALDRIGEYVGASRGGKNDDDYRNEIYIQVGANFSEGREIDITGLLRLFSIDHIQFFEPAVADFYYFCSRIPQARFNSVINSISVSKAAGISYDLVGIVDDGFSPIEDGTGAFCFDGGAGLSFAVLQDDGAISHGGRYPVLLTLDELEGVSVAEFSVGSIQTSILTEPQFQSQMGSTDWVLMDGRGISGSKLQVVTGMATLPDARGLFMRMTGDNSLYPQIPNTENSILDVVADKTAPKGLAGSTGVGGTSVQVGGTSVQVGGTNVTVGGTSFSDSVSGSTNSDTHYHNTFISYDGNSGAVYNGTFAYQVNGSNSGGNDQSYHIYGRNSGTPNIFRTTSDTHNHTFSGSVSGTTSSTTRTTATTNRTTGTTNRTTATDTRAAVLTGDIETAPWHIQVNYFIKIN